MILVFHVVFVNVLTLTLTQVANGSLTVLPRDVVATVGQSVEFTCGTTEDTPVNWDYRHSPTSAAQRIVYGGGLDGDLNWKFETKKNGVYKLKLLSVNASDAGWYICTDKTGIGPDTAAAMLIVLGEDPKCTVNVTEINYIDANRCEHVQHDYANISCSVSYSGNTPPVLTLSNEDEMYIENSEIMAWTFDNYTVTSLLVPVNTIKDGTSYSCRVSASNTYSQISHMHNHHCRTPAISAASSYNADEQFTCNMETFQCSPCVSPPCSYQWINRHSNEVVSSERTLSLKKVVGRPYAYQCQIICKVDGHTYTTESDTITCLEHSHILFVKHHIVVYPVLGLVVIGLLTGVIVLCIFLCKTLRRPKIYTKDAEPGYSNSNLLKQSDDTIVVAYGQDYNPKAEPNEPNETNNMERLPLELRESVLMKTSVSYFRFHWQTFRELKRREILEYLAMVCVDWHKTMTQRNWFATTLRRRLDHVCAPYKRRVRRTTTLDTQSHGVTGVAQLEDRIYAVCYESDQVRVFMARPPFTRVDDIKISDMKTPHDIAACTFSNCLYICDLNGNCVWRVTDDHKVDKWLDQFIIKPYTMSVSPLDGRVLLVSIRSKRLSVYSKNADLITNIDMLNESDIRHVVCSSNGTFIMSQKTLVEVGQDGKVLRKYVGDREPENLNCPVHIALDPDSETGLFVLDYVNHRILQFTTSLKLIRCVADKGLMNHENPMWRLCYAKGQLMVGMENNGNVEVYGMI